MKTEQGSGWQAPLTPRQRVQLALQHRATDRVPVDFLATPEVWEKLVHHFNPDPAQIDSGGFFSPEREAILRLLEVDCRVISYDMFCAPPERFIRPGASIDWWQSLARSTPNRMWRQTLPDGSSLDIFGRHTRPQANDTGHYEEFISFPLAGANDVSDLKGFEWPTPEWWDFSALPQAIQKVDPHGQLSLRYRAGTVFEAAWQLRGMEAFLTDLAINPAIPLYIMERLTEILVENLRQVLELSGDRIDIVYFYDDMGAQNGLMISKNMWQRYIRPLHQRIIDLAKSRGKLVMYHSDGAIRSLVPELIEMGVDILDPIQPTAKDMQPERLKAEFGDRLCFHGGVDIVGTLPRGTPDEVRQEVRQRVQTLGANGGYILSSSHHIQSDTPLENVLAMYEVNLRYP